VTHANAVPSSATCHLPPARKAEKGRTARSVHCRRPNPCVQSPLKNATRSAVTVTPREAKRNSRHSARSEAQSRNPPRPPDTGPCCSAEGAAQFQPRATPWEYSSDERFPSPEGAAHSSPTNAVRARWIALSGLVLSERHGSQGDALGFRGSPRWGLFTRPPPTPTRTAGETRKRRETADRTSSLMLRIAFVNRLLTPFRPVR
jgi:hypothetical protein